MEESPDKSKDEVKFVFTPVTDWMKRIFLSDMKQIPVVYIGDYHLQLELDELSPELKEKAKNELGETPDVTRDAIQSLRQLLNDEKDLKVPIDNDLWLTKFLRATKFNHERAFRLIKRYYKFKVTYSDIYKNLKPSNEKNIFQQNILTLQQERDQHGRRVLTVHLGNKWKPNEVTLDEVFKGFVLLSELALLEPQTQVCGSVTIVDMEGLSMSQATKFTPLFFKRLLEWLQTCIPLNVVNIHVVNQPYIFKILYSMIKLFLREDMKDRLVLHGKNYQSLHKYINPDCLSVSYGGTLKLPTSVDGNVWLDILLLCNQEFEVINSYGYTSERVVE